ncbi:hypothetical protein MferCBS31731_000250 [Microsporum ferrugineum]
MPLFASLFSRRRSRQAREEKASASNAAGASAVQKNGTNHKAPRVELDLPHIKPSEETQLEADTEPRTPAENADDKVVNPASIELPSSPQNGQAMSPGTVSKKQSLMSVRSDGQQQPPQFFKEGKRRNRRMSVFSSLRSRPSTAMSTATEPAPELQMSPVTSNVSRTYFPPDPKFQLDLKPDTFSKAFNGSSLPFVDEMFGDKDKPESSSKTSGWLGQQNSNTTTAATASDSGNNVSRGWLLPGLESVMDGDTLNTNTNATLTQPSSPVNGTSNSPKSLPSPTSLPPLSASPESSKSSSRTPLEKSLSKSLSPSTPQGSVPSSPTAITTTTTTPNGVTV